MKARGWLGVVACGAYVNLLVLAIMVVAAPQFALAQAAKIRWDIVTLPTFTPPTIKEGGVTFASATDGTFIKLTGSGTFGPTPTDPVTGGGAWETYTVSRTSTAKGTYTVTGLVSFAEAPGALPPTFVDQIGPLADARAGLAILRVEYKNADGGPAGTGILVVSCHLPGAPDSMFEGVIASKGPITYFDRALTMPAVDANRTLFHRQ